MQNRDAVDLIEGIDDADFSPNEWEEGFLNDMREMVDRGCDLSTGQGGKLEEIYRKASGGGGWQQRQRFK